jgi:phosphohistidine phosphatase SixA
MSRILTSFLAMLLAAAASAQGSMPLADPTRPPTVGREIAAEAAEAATPVGPRLESVLISPTRRAVVISGQAVAAGGRYGEATVETITESAVVLRYPDRRQTLQLMPGLSKRERGLAETAPDPIVTREKKGTAR